jgi:hypothetical protein
MCDGGSLADWLGASDAVWSFQMRSEQHRQTAKEPPSLRVVAKMGARCVARLRHITDMPSASRLAVIPFWSQRIARTILR